MNGFNNPLRDAKVAQVKKDLTFDLKEKKEKETKIQYVKEKKERGKYGLVDIL